MEAMKMEHTLRATTDAQIDVVHCQADAMVQPDQLLIAFAAASEELQS